MKDMLKKCSPQCMPHLTGSKIEIEESRGEHFFGELLVYSHLLPTLSPSTRRSFVHLPNSRKECSPDSGFYGCSPIFTTANQVCPRSWRLDFNRVSLL